MHVHLLPYYLSRQTRVYTCGCLAQPFEAGRHRNWMLWQEEAAAKLASWELRWVEAIRSAGEVIQ
jgi:hypothetical protein